MSVDAANEPWDILYVSSVPSRAEFDRIRSALKPGVQEVSYGMAAASFRFHTLIMEGMASAGARVTSVVGRPVSPRFHAPVWWPRSAEPARGGVRVIHPAFVNRPVVKQVGLAAGLARQTWRWRRDTRQSLRRAVFVDGSYVSAMPGVLLALWGAGAPRVGIFADLYSYMADVADASDRQVDTVHKISRRVVRRCLDSLDAVVVLTSAMDALINRESKPSVVMEGLVDVNQSARAVSLANRHTHPTALYAGALRREYGVEDLVLGFRSIPDPQARLEIYGQGDYAEEVRRHAAEDTRITFAGTVPVEVVLEAEERAWVLVNPRPANQEFTKYSFPSKNMEYLASGTAVLTTPLPGMPPEYYPHVMLIDESSPAGVRGALERAFALGRGELHRRGERGKEFVLTSKTNTIWAGKLLALARRAGA